MNRQVKYYYDDNNEPIKIVIKMEVMKKKDMILGKILYMKEIDKEMKEDE